MAQLILSIFVDGTMAVLLVLTIYYCWRLNIRIKVLQDSKGELAKIIKQFDESTQMATRSIAEIHKATNRIAENIQHKIDKANYLADDLQFMIEKGNKIADRMDGGISAGRPASAAAPTRPAAPSRKAEDAGFRRQAVEEAAAAIEEAKAGVSSQQPAASGATLDSVLQRMTGRRPADGDAADARGKRPGARLRSKSEQELLEALKGGNKA